MIHNSSSSREFLPYCLDRVEDGQDTFVLLNRHYRPIAMPESKMDLNANRSIHFQIVGMTSEIAATLSIHGDPFDGRIYFYDDGTAPWLGKRHDQEYEKRMLLLRLLIGDSIERTPEAA